MNKMNRILFALIVSVSAAVSAASAGELSVVAGNGSKENNGDEGGATELAVKDTFGVEFGPDGALYVTEVGHHRIRRVDLKTNRISTVVGNGTKGYSGDGGLATEAKLNEPYEVRFDKDGNMYFVEMQNHTVRRVDAATKKITTIAGTGKSGFSGDGGPATKATFNRPHSIALDNHGHLYVADIGNHRIRRINLETGIVETIAGNGEKELPPDGETATGKPIFGPRALFIKGEAMWIALREGNSVWKLDLKSGKVHHVAGSGKKGHIDAEASAAAFNGPKGIAVDKNSNAFLVDTENHVIRRIDGKTSSVTTIAGAGTPGAKVGSATSSQMNRPHGICIGSDASIYVGDTLNHRVVKITQ